MARLSELDGSVVGIDTVVFIYAFENHPALGGIAMDLFRSIELGKMSGVASDLVLGELLVKPLKMQRRDVADRYLDDLPTFPNLSFKRVSRDVVVQAARLRARTSAGLVDALHLASAVAAGAKCFITNDQRWPRENLGMRVLLLSELED